MRARSIRAENSLWMRGSMWLRQDEVEYLRREARGGAWQ